MVNGISEDDGQAYLGRIVSSWNNHEELALAIIAHSEGKLSLEYLKEMAKTVLDKLK